MNIKEITINGFIYDFIYSVDLDKITEKEFRDQEGASSPGELFPYLHNDSGPAMSYLLKTTKEITSCWYIVEGLPHSFNGPAISNPMHDFYYIYGIECLEEDYIEAVEYYKENGVIAFILKYKGSN